MSVATFCRGNATEACKLCDCSLAPEGQKAVEGQKAQPMGAKATEGKPEGKPFIGPKRGSAVGVQFHMRTSSICWMYDQAFLVCVCFGTTWAANGKSCNSCGFIAALWPEALGYYLPRNYSSWQQSPFHGKQWNDAQLL